MTKINLKIVCGCNSSKTPAIFTSLIDAENHSKATGHQLVISGTVVTTPDWVK